MEIKQVTPAESTHWYDADGNPAYEVQAKDGSMRPTTLRDARKLNLRPSVTTILGILAKPGLDAWKQNQTIDAALTLPRLEGESLDDFKVRVIQDSKEQGRKASQLGTDIHSSLDKAYQGLPYDPEHDVYVKAVQEAVFLKYGDQKWIAEKSFSHPLGFGGKIDLASENIVIDFKTTGFTDPKKVGGYDEHQMQLAGYATGLCIQHPILANVYASTTIPGLVHILEYTEEEAKRGWEMFALCLRLWQVSKGYFPNA